MWKAPDHEYLVSDDGKLKVKNCRTEPENDPGKKKCKAELEELVEELHELQRILYAHDHHSVLLIFQALDAAGKDSTIRAVMSGVNPAGCQVYSFKQPSAEELDHDFLWRCALRLPERGRIGIFNRSFYEEVLVVRVHPEFLENQRLPADVDWKNIWQHRFESIRNFEEHLARNGTIILKFWLHVSLAEQKQRFLDRLNTPEKNWKFSAGDVAEREHYKDYMQAFEEAINATSRPWAPWYAIPADDKPYMRMTVARIIVDALKSLGLKYPEVTADEKARFDEMRNILEQQ